MNEHQCKERVFAGDVVVVRQLLQSGADKDICDRWGRTALDWTSNDDCREALRG